MNKAISNTSPLLFLYRIDSLQWLSSLFSEVWIPNAVVMELESARTKGYDTPNLKTYKFVQIIDPIKLPSEWLSLELGPGELAAMSLALDNPEFILLIDDSLARRTAIAAGLKVWGTLRILLEAKIHGIIPLIEPYVDKLENIGIWISDDVRNRILKLAGEKI